MKADLCRNGDEDPGGRSCVQWLQHWDVPEPPAQIEDDLREAFRRRRPKHRPALWLTLAAAAVLFAVWWVDSGGRAEAPVPAETPVAKGASPPPPASAEGVRPLAAATAAAAAAAPAAARGSGRADGGARRRRGRSR